MTNNNGGGVDEEWKEFEETDSQVKGCVDQLGVDSAVGVVDITAEDTVDIQFRITSLEGDQCKI